MVGSLDYGGLVWCDHSKHDRPYVHHHWYDLERLDDRSKSFSHVLWVNSGISLLVSFAVLRVDLFVLYFLGVSGISFAFERPLKYRHLVHQTMMIIYGSNVGSSCTTWLAGISCPTGLGKKLPRRPGPFPRSRPGRSS